MRTFIGTVQSFGNGLANVKDLANLKNRAVIDTQRSVWKKPIPNIQELTGVGIRRALLAVIMTVAMSIVASGCASDGGSGSSNPRASASGKIKICRSGDQSITSAAQCMKDDAACYQVADGSWCTGARGNTCPTGSTALPASGKCPAGSRCIAITESLNCAILTQ